MIHFSLKFDDDKHSLTKENGISLDKIGGLLESLFDAINTGSGKKCTLGQIRGNCYALDFYSEDEGYLKNFITVNKNISQLSVNDLLPEEKKYASKLRVILGDRYYVKAYDNENSEIAKITEIGEKPESYFYYTTETVYGVLSLLGSAALNAPRKHIYLDGVGLKIYISKNQDLQLKQYYGTHKLRAEVKQKRSSVDGHVIFTELDSFVPLSLLDISDSFDAEGYIDFELIKNTNTVEDILNRIYANR